METVKNIEEMKKFTERVRGYIRENTEQKKLRQVIKLLGKKEKLLSVLPPFAKI